MKKVYYIMDEETKEIVYVTDNQRNAHEVIRTYWNLIDYGIYAGTMDEPMYESLRATVHAEIFEPLTCEGL